MRFYYIFEINQLSITDKYGVINEKNKWKHMINIYSVLK